MECGGHQDCSSIGQNPRYGGLFSPPSDLRWTGDSQRPQTIFGSQDHSPPDSAAPSHHPPLNPELFHGTRGLQPSHSLLTWHPPPHSNSLPTSQEAMPSTLMNEMAHAQWASPVLTSCTPDCLQYFDPAQTVCPFHAMNNDDQIAYFNMYASRVSTPAPPAHHGDSGATDKEPESSSEPYAVLIYKALKSAPGHRMVLKDIYEWFENNTDKNNGPSKGWQNSIRHNLSMNGVSFTHF